MRNHYFCSFLLFVGFIVVLPAHHEGGKNIHFDETLYSDLLNDPSKKRFLDVFYHPGINHGGYIFSEEEKEEIKWSEEHAVKNFPVLLEVLKREPNPVDNADLEGWSSLQKKKHVLYWIKAFPEGDVKPFVDEVRLQLPILKEIQIANHDSHTGFIGESLNLLARKGDASDFDLIESFLDDVNGNNRLHAVRSLEKLKVRLSQEQRERENRIESSLQVFQRKQKEPAFSNSENNEKSASWLYWILGALISGGVGVLVWNSRKGSSAR